MSWITTLLDQLTYPVIAFLMMLESTVVPVPSELVIAPAAYHAANGEMSLIGIILVATIGADIGASINYAVAYYLGRPIVYRFATSRLGHLCLLNEAKMQKAEDYFNKHGGIATITGRLIIGIRHLISLPAGLAKMSYPKFLVYTTIGATIWHTILALLGLYLRTIIPEDQLTTTVEHYSHHLTLAIIAIVAVILIAVICKSLTTARKH